MNLNSLKSSSNREQKHWVMKRVYRGDRGESGVMGGNLAIEMEALLPGPKPSSRTAKPLNSTRVLPVVLVHSTKYAP